jgi:heat shock protein HslJ
MHGKSKEWVVMKRLAAVWVTMFVGLILGGCATTMELEGSRWRLTEVDGAPAIPASDERAAHIVFERSPTPRVSGSTGCNRFVGSYESSGSSLTFGAIASTRMACPDAMAQERAFEQALQDVRQWRAEDGELELLDEQDTVRLRFAVMQRE